MVDQIQLTAVVTVLPKRIRIKEFLSVLDVDPSLMDARSYIVSAFLSEAAWGVRLMKPEPF